MYWRTIRLPMSPWPDQALRNLLAEHDVVIELLPISLAMKVGRIAAETGTHLVSSMYYIGQSMTDPVLFRQMKQEMDEIDEIARRNGCTLLIAFGMDPGLEQDGRDRAFLFLRSGIPRRGRLQQPFVIQVFLVTTQHPRLLLPRNQEDRGRPDGSCTCGQTVRS